MNEQHAIGFAKELGITISHDDIGRVVQAIQNAYRTGLNDGAMFEREQCASLLDERVMKCDKETAKL